MTHIAMVVNGILRDPITGHPDRLGRTLYHSLANNARLTLLTDSNKQPLYDWLRIEEFDRHTAVSLIDVTYIDDLQAGRLHQIRHLRAVGPVDLVITPEPELVTHLYDMGQPCLLHVDPKTTPTLPPRETWSAIADRISGNRVARAARLQDEDP